MRDPEYNTLVPFARQAMACPACGHAGLEPHTRDDELRCVGCGARYPGLNTVPDLAVDAPTPRPGALRRLTGWGPTARWGRRSARPALERWARGRGDDDRPEWLTAWLRPVPGPVLALCCATGRTASDVARWMGVARVIGIDTDLQLLGDTQGSPLDPGLAYVRAPAEQLPFQDASVGGVTALAGLHQAPDPLARVAEAGRVLAPGGRFVGAIHLDHGPAGLRGLSRALGEPAVAREAFEAAVQRAGMQLLALQVRGMAALFAAHRP